MRDAPVRRSRRRRATCASALFWLTAAAAAATTPGARETDAFGAPLLVGALVHQHEVGALDVLLDVGGGYLVPLDAFAEIAGCTVSHSEGAARVSTPLGAVELRAPEVREIDGVVYLSSITIERELATPVAFDRSRFALDFAPPWRTAAGSSPTSLQGAIPDVTAPDLSLSTLESDVRYTRGGGEEGRYGSATTIGGRMLDGHWRLRYQDDLAGARHLRDYAWFQARDRTLLLAGHQNVRLHPLLSNVELTGVQLAATNGTLERFARSAEPGALLSREVQPFTAFRGPGPPAGVAELWVNGSLAERQVIGLDGIWDFEDVSLPVRQASRVEVRVYDRRNLDVPVAIHEEQRNASEFLLEDGALMQMGGVGGTGNALDESAPRASEPAGFYQARYGVSDRFTLEAAAQRADGAAQAFGGLVARLGRPFVAALGVAGSEGGRAYRVELDGQSSRWRLAARSQVVEAGFRPHEPTNGYEHMLEAGVRRAGSWDLALVGESWKSGTERVDYLLPAVAWRPAPPFGLRARPDHHGDYRFDLSWRAAPGTHLTLSGVDDRGFVDLVQEVGSRYQLALEGDFGGELPDRQAALVSFRGRSPWRPSWTAGGQLTGAEPGYLLAGSLSPWPGIVGRVQYESDAALEQLEPASDDRLLVNLTADLGISRGRIHAARTVAIRDDRGGVAGTVRVDAPRGFPHPRLDGLTILLDGRAVGRTEAGGGYFVGDLRPGVYRLELDPSGLPIELTPTVALLVAEVAPAAVTRADFVVRPEFGIAGRVVDLTGTFVAGAPLELLDEAGTPVGVAVTDRFGLYRMDGLPLGRYRLRFAGGESPGESPAREIVIDGEFLFDQDLVWPVVRPRRVDPTSISRRRDPCPGEAACGEDPTVE